MLRVLLLSALILAGCGDSDGEDTATDTMSDTGDEPADPPPPPGNTVTGEVMYTGSQSGNLVFGLYTSLPPMGPPVAFSSIEAPEFPAEFTLSDVDEGTYQLLTVFDVGGDNPTLPGDEDLQVASEPFEVTAELGAWVDVEITEE